jgi:hypothetical protein
MILSKLFSASKNKEEKLKYEQGFEDGFAMGFSKAWDMMMPHLFTGFEKVKDNIIYNAKMETLKGLQGALRGKNGTDSTKD